VASAERARVAMPYKKLSSPKLMGEESGSIYCRARHYFMS
jgi:hypothetical protein